MNDPTPRPPLEESSPREKREDIRAEYDAEFDVGDPSAASDTAQAQAQLMKLEADSGSLASLLGPSPRTVIQRLELEFRRKIRDMEREVAEMMEREVALKQANRTAVEHSHKLAEERNYWADMKDPERVNSALREDAAKSKTLYQGAVQRCFELEADGNELKARIADLEAEAEKLKGTIVGLELGWAKPKAKKRAEKKAKRGATRSSSSRAPTRGKRRRS